jgi:hypothetical protein
MIPNKLEWKIESALLAGERYESLAAACEITERFSALRLSTDSKLEYDVDAKKVGRKFAGLPVRYMDYGSLWPPSLELVIFTDEKPSWLQKCGSLVNRNIVRQIISRQFARKRIVNVCLTPAHEGREESV